MARPPWADLVQAQSNNGYAEEVNSDVGEHLRTRPAEGFTPPGGGRPGAPTIDTAPIDYRQGTHDREYGLKDTDELASPPPPVRAGEGKPPMQPQEFEAAWQDRYLQRTAAQQTQPKPKLILPANYNSSTSDNDIEAMQQQMRAMQFALNAAMVKREEEAKAAVQNAATATLSINVRIVNGVPEASITSAGVIADVSVAAALAVIQALVK